jgi:hypothetical protein
VVSLDEISWFRGEDLSRSYEGSRGGKTHGIKVIIAQENKSQQIMKEKG